MRYGDILLFKPTGIIGKLITLVDGSDYSHGAIYLGKFKGEDLFIESHESKGGVVIQKLDAWRKNYVVVRPKGKPIPIEKTLELLNRKYDYGRLWFIFKSKLRMKQPLNNDPYKLICTELCDYVWNYTIGEGEICTPATIYNKSKSW